MSLGNLLGIARSAMVAHQTAVGVTAQNIANAQTEGYSRRLPALRASTPVVFTYGAVGTGVELHDIGRVRDTLLDGAYRREAAGSAGHALRRDLLQQVEGVLGEPSEQGLASALDAFWNAWGDLANHPNSGAARAAVLGQGQQVAGLFNSLAARVEEVQHSTALRVEGGVERLNGLARQVAELNGHIVSAEVGGHTAGDLRDERDRALDEMAKLGPVRVLEEADGSVGVLFGSTKLVDRTDAKALELAGDGRTTPFALQIRGASSGVRVEGGEIGQLLGMLGTVLGRDAASDPPGLLAQLDELAAGVAGAVNGLHTDGTASPPAFFGAAGAAAQVTAANLRVVLSGADAIVVSTSTPGDTNSVALALAQLRTTPVADAPFNGKTIAGRYEEVVAGLALETSGARRDADVAGTLAAQAEAQRSSVSGVSVDEEMVRLMQQQQAYTAAARLVNVADEMIQAVLNMV